LRGGLRRKRKGQREGTRAKGERGGGVFGGGLQKGCLFQGSRQKRGHKTKDLNTKKGGKTQRNSGDHAHSGIPHEREKKDGDLTTCPHSLIIRGGGGPVEKKEKRSPRGAASATEKSQGKAQPRFRKCTVCGEGEKKSGRGGGSPKKGGRSLTGKNGKGKKCPWLRRRKLQLLKNGGTGNTSPQQRQGEYPIKSQFNAPGSPETRSIVAEGRKYWDAY